MADDQQGSHTSTESNAVLLVTDQYATSKEEDVSTMNRQVVQILTGAGRKVYSLVLEDTEEDRKCAEADGVELILPTSSQEDTRKPCLDWLTFDHRTHYPKLPQDVGWIVGHASFTSRAAATIKEERFTKANLSLVTRTIPEDTEKYMTEEKAMGIGRKEDSIRQDAAKAKTVFSVGHRIHDHFKNTFRAIPKVTRPTHCLFLPEPCEIFKETTVEYVESGEKIVLLVSKVNEVEKQKGLDFAAKAIARVAKRSQDRIQLRIRGVSEEEYQASMNILQASINSGKLIPTLLPHGTQEDICRDMQQAHLVLMPSRTEPFGLIGLEAMAAGVPVRISDQSGLATLVKKVIPEFHHSVLGITGDDSVDVRHWADQIEKVLRMSKAEFSRATALKQRLLESKYWEDSHQCLLQAFGGAGHVTQKSAAAPVQKRKRGAALLRETSTDEGRKCSKQETTVMQQADTMSEPHRTLLLRNYLAISQDLDATRVLDYLHQHKVLTDRMRRDILAIPEDQRQRRTRKLLDWILHGDDNTYNIFCTALEQAGYRHLMELLTEGHQERMPRPSRFFYFIKEKVSSNWKDLAFHLGFTEQSDISYIASRGSDDKSQCMEMLWEWKKKKGDGATIEVLSAALLEAGLQNVVDSLKRKYPGDTGKRSRRKRKRKGRADQSQEDNSSSGSSLASMDIADQACDTPSQNYFSYVAKAVGSSWRKFAEDQLGLTAQDIHGIHLRHPYSKQQQALQALELWRDRRGRKACRVKLAEALKRGGFQHTADQLETYNNRNFKMSGHAENKTDRSDYIPLQKGSDTFLQSNSNHERKTRGKKEQQEKISVKPKKRKKSNSKDTTDDQSCVDGDNLIENSKTAIHSTYLRIHENVFDGEIVQDACEFNRCMGSMEKIESVIYDTDDEQHKLQSEAKLRIKKRVNNKIAEVAENMFSDRVLDPANRDEFHKMAECFKRYGPSVKKARRGCVLCFLDFPDAGCYDTFWRGYTDGSLSDTLTRELITDDMRAAEGGADLYIHVRVVDTASEDREFSDYDPSGTRDRGSPQPFPEHSGHGPPVPGSSTHGDDTPPSYHGTGGRQVSGGDDVFQVKQEPAEQVPSCSTMGIIKPELDRQMSAIADHLGSMWERLALSLGFNTDYIQNLTARLSPSICPHQLIRDWMERNVGDVTMDELVQALRDAGIHEVADAAASGQLFLTAAECEAAKGKPDGEMDAGRPDGDERSNGRSPDNTGSKASALGSGGSLCTMEEVVVSEDTSLSSVSRGSTVIPSISSMYPTGEDALAWHDCFQDFFKADKDVIQETWPSNLLVKHFIRDSFFHSHLCEYWKQYLSFPSSLATFIEFLTKMSAKQFCYDNDISNEHFKSVYEQQCLVVGKAAFDSQKNNESVFVYDHWGDLQQSGFGWLKPVDSSEDKDAFQFIHDSIRQFLMAVWVAHTVRTQTDYTELLRVCAEKSDHLSITCYSLAHLLRDRYLHEFVRLLMERQEGLDNFDCQMSLMTVTAESKQLDVLSSLVQNVIPDQILDLTALPEIPLHGLHCLTQIISSTNVIQTIRLPDKVRLQDVLKHYPFGQKRRNALHTNQIRYISYLPLFDCLSSMSDAKGSSVTELYFVKTDQQISVEIIQQYLQFAPSLKEFTIRSGKFKTGVLSSLSKSLLFTPNVRNVVIALQEISSEDTTQTINVLNCLPNMRHVELTEYTNSGGCPLSMRHGHFSLQCKIRSNAWHSIFSLHPSNIRKLSLEGRRTDRFSERACLSLPFNDMSGIVSSFPQLKCLIEMRFAFLWASDWLTLLHELVSYVEGEVAGTFPLLEVFGCTNCCVTGKESPLIASFLATVKNLKEIDLSHNDISNEGGPGLVEGLGSCQNLKKLNLSHNRLSARGDLLPPLPNLEEIDLSHNYISGESLPDLTTNLGFCQNIRKINLSYNRLFDIGDFLPCLPSLEEIDLSNSYITDKAVPGLFKSLSSFQTLKKVSLGHNRLSNKGDFLPPLPNLEEVDLSHNFITNESLPGLAKGLGSCQQLKKVNLSHNKLSTSIDFFASFLNLEETYVDISYNDDDDDLHCKGIGGLGRVPLNHQWANMGCSSSLVVSLASASTCI